MPGNEKSKHEKGKVRNPLSRGIMWLMWILAELSGDDLTPSAAPWAWALHIRLPPAMGSATQQIRTGSNRTVFRQPALAPSRQRLEGKGRALCVPHSASPLSKGDGRELHSSQMEGSDGHSLPPAMLMSWQPGAHICCSCVPASPRATLEKKKNTAKNRLPCTLFCSQGGKKKKKDAILSLCKYNTSNFFSSIAQVKMGNRYVHRKNKHLQVPLKGRNERATAAGVITVAERVGFMCWGKRLTNREEWTAFRENATGSIVLFQKPIKWAVLGRYTYLGAGAVPQNNHTRKLFYWVPSDSHSRNRILCLKQKPASQLRKAASVLILFFAPRGRNLQQGRMRICNKRETGRSPVGSDS